jgi:hypothetical protein
MVTDSLKKRGPITFLHKIPHHTPTFSEYGNYVEFSALHAQLFWLLAYSLIWNLAFIFKINFIQNGYIS